MKRVLLCSVGLSPQVVTETLYALDRQENWQPDELIIVTTPGGKAGCKRLLLNGNTMARQMGKKTCAPGPSRSGGDR